jgi:outer membrane receptor protein involved in Fe transport
VSTIVGARFDRFGFDVSDELEDEATLGTRTSGVRDAMLLSPKATLVLSPRSDWDVYLNFGLGFHSNDARGVVRGEDPVTPLTRATGGELGTRFRVPGGLDVALSGFVLDLDSEIVWVGDEGTTEARGPTRRLGAEAELRWELLPWLVADADGTWSRARFIDAPEAVSAVPLAPSLLFSGGLSALHPSGAYGRVGGVFLADRAATEDRLLTAEGFARLDATLGYRSERFELGVAVQNLFDTEWREAQFANVSRIVGETSCPPGTRAASGDSGLPLPSRRLSHRFALRSAPSWRRQSPVGEIRNSVTSSRCRRESDRRVTAAWSRLCTIIRYSMPSA